MRVLVTGADGYIGAMLTPMLLERGHRVVGLDAGYYRDGWLYDDGRRRAPVISKDIRQIDAADVVDFDAVVHLAELFHSPLGEHDPRLAFEINHRGSVDLALTCKTAGIGRFVYLSSCGVYGGSAHVEPCDETSPPDPQTVYAQCKVMVERDVQALADDHFTPVFLRTATVFGPSPRMRFDTLLNGLAGTAWTGGVVEVRSDGSALHPMVHVDDIATAICHTLEAPREAVHNEIFNVGDKSRNYRLRDIAEIVATAFPGSKLTFGPSGGDSRNHAVSFDKIHRHLPDFRCRYDAKDGAEQLHGIFAEIAMTREVFAFRAFTRLRQLHHLIGTKRIDAAFRWRREALVPA